MLAFKIYHHLHPPDCDSPCTLHHQSHSMEGGGGTGKLCAPMGGGKAEKLHVLVGGVGELHVPVILLL